MHEDWTPCPRCCADGDGPDPECWWCEGSGWVDPDGAIRPKTGTDDDSVVERYYPDLARRLEESARSLSEALCPRCQRSAYKRAKSPRYFCDRCGYKGDGDDLTAFDEDVVKDDPNVLNREGEPDG